MSATVTFTDYFQSYEHYFWQWEEQGEVLAIPNAQTIAYREQVKTLFDQLAPQGVPPFGSLLLAIIATNEKGHTALDAVNRILQDQLNEEQLPVLMDAIPFLKLLSEVPAAYKQGKKRVLLFQAMFERCHQIVSAKTSIELRDGLQQQFTEQPEITIPKAFNVPAFVRDFKTIALLRHQFQSVNDILKRIAALPEMDAVELVQEDTVGERVDDRDLIDQLTEHPQTFPVGSLVKRIWGGLNIPLHSALPSEQPLGGVSDLSNKGDFDKLLITEFANDDLVFMSRLANNEALYLHREIPPTNNKLQRVILIDVSLKTWGTPKAIAFATMLAIAKHPHTTYDCKAYVMGDRYHPVSIDSVHSIIEGMQLVSGSLDASNGLEAYFNDHPRHQHREHFIITSPDAAKQAAMQQAMHAHHALISYWIHTDAAGNIDIYKKQQQGKKHVQHIQLPLTALWKKYARHNHTTSTDGAYPADYPLLFRNSSGMRQLLPIHNGEVYQLTSDKCLWRLYNRFEKQGEKGWEMVYENLPTSSAVFEMGVLSNGQRVLLAFNPSSRQTTLINIDTHRQSTVVFDGWQQSALFQFVFHDDHFCHLTAEGTYFISMNGEITLRNALEQSVFEERHKFIQKHQSRYNLKHSVFKNVKDVYINEANNLVLNKHELRINNSHQIKLDTTQFLTKTTKAVKQGEHEFMFDDGSVVEINRAGIITLKSSNHNLPWIYIPLSINSLLGVATESEFAGNTFFYKDPLYEVKILSTGSQNLTLVRMLHEHLEISLSDAQHIIHFAPTVLPGYLSHQQAETVKKALELAEATVALTPVTNEHSSFTGLRVISAQSFFQHYIEPFIQTIQSNGTSS